MFSFEQSDDLLSQIFTTPHQEQTNQQDQIMGYASLENHNLNNNLAQRQNQNIINTADYGDPRANDAINKRTIHREIERKRRKQQAILFASLRSLLPFEFIKGRRSITDHIDKAAEYIKHLENNIEELDAKREKLKRLSNASSLSHGNIGSSEIGSNNYFAISQSMAQVVVTFSDGFEAENLQLSSVLELLLEQGLDVVSCVTTKVNGRLLHTIQSEVNDQTCFNLSSLQQKLGNYVSR